MFEDAESDFSNESDSMETGTAELELEVDDIAADDIAGYRDLLAEISGENFFEVYHNQ